MTRALLAAMALLAACASSGCYPEGYPSEDQIRAYRAQRVACDAGADCLSRSRLAFCEAFPLTTTCMQEKPHGDAGR